MTTVLTALLFALAIWWLGTGVVLFLQQRLAPGRHAALFSLAAVAAIAGTTLVYSSNSLGAAYSYISFTAAVTLWGTLELSHYLGLVTGVHERYCPADCIGWRRFGLALGTSIWHELSILLTGFVLIWVLLPAENLTGLYTFLVLWVMRWSAKLNLFFGVPNFSTEWFPDRMSHLKSYVKPAPISLFFPFSVALSLMAIFFLGTQAMQHTSGQGLVYVLPMMLLCLAVIEHLFMVIPVADTALWNRLFSNRSAQLSAPVLPVPIVRVNNNGAMTASPANNINSSSPQ